RRRHTRSKRDWSSDVCSSDLYITLVYNCNRFLSSLFFSFTIVITILYNLLSVLFTDINHNEGGNRIRTGDQGFADLCIPTWLYHHINYSNAFMVLHVFTFSCKLLACALITSVVNFCQVIIMIIIIIYYRFYNIGMNNSKWRKLIVSIKAFQPIAFPLRDSAG